MHLAQEATADGLQTENMKIATTARSRVAPVGPATRRGTAGFTLIELMVVVVVVGILAGLAYPSYLGQVRKSRRADAVTAIAQVQQAQERWRASASTYTSTLSNLNVAATSAGGYYTISTATIAGSLTCPDATTKTCAAGSCFSVTATAVSTKSQQSDTGCTAVVGTWLGACGGAMTYTPTACWSK
jgi:type IV pilus assembly protein PilE